MNFLFDFYYGNSYSFVVFLILNILVLMCSFNTLEDTHKIIRKYSGMRILTFRQFWYPRINAESLMPIGKEVPTEKNIDA